MFFMNEEKNSLSETPRRQFLKQMAIIGLVTGIPPVLWSCQQDEKTPINYLGTGAGPYKVWEEMLMALETSPDHLEGRYKKLIAEKDPKAMFDFVRDEIHLMPAKRAEIHGMQTAIKYGTKGALRYGFATPREKAELLHEMYLQAGINSKVVYEIIDIPDDEVPSFFYRPIKRPFAPAIDDAIRERWAKELGAYNKDAKDYDLLNPDLSASQKLAEEVWQTLPNKDRINSISTSFSWDYYGNGTPTLEFEWEGETKYAHLFDPEVPFGALKNKEKADLRPARPAELNDEKINISLSFRTGMDPNVETELISREWLVNEMEGNRVGLSFQNGLSLEEQMVTSFGDLRTFTPALSLQGFDLTLPYMEERSFIGNPFTLEGKVMDLSGDKIKVDGSEIIDKSDKNLQKTVSKLEIAAIPALFPLVKLEVTPTNAEGEFVEGLSATDFSIVDNESPIKAIMKNNQRTPNVLILYDISKSMPLEYRDEGMDSFIETLEKSILTTTPNARLEKWPTDSSLFTWLLRASQTTNDLIIFATDGDNDDTFDPKMEAYFKSGPPAVVLSVNGTSSDSFDIMAASTNGVVLNALDQEETAAKVTSFLEKIVFPPYVFTYYASGNDIPHEVNLTLDEKRLSAKSNYKFDVQVPNDHLLSQNIAGLYLTIKSKTKTVKRLLAGWSEYDKNLPTRQDFLDVRNTIIGGVLISIEGEGPTLSTALCDELKYKLSTRNWGEPLMEGEDEKAIEEFKKGGFHYNPLFIPLMAPLAGGVTENSYTYAAGPRIGILKQHIGIGETHSTLSFDYIPTSDYLSLDTDPLKAFKTTIEKTAQLAVLEHRYFPKNNTMALLKTKPLIDLETAYGLNWFRDNEAVEKDPVFWNAQLRSNYYGNKTTLYTPFTLFDKTASEKAYWQISHDTGELYGILFDGSGGGARSVETQLKDIDNVVEAYAKILDHMAQGLSGALPIVAMYSKTLVKLYAIASVAIVIMDGTNMDKEIRKALIDLANEVAEHIAEL